MDISLVFPFIFFNAGNGWFVFAGALSVTKISVIALKPILVFNLPFSPCKGDKVISFGFIFKKVFVQPFS